MITLEDYISENWKQAEAVWNEEKQVFTLFASEQHDYGFRAGALLYWALNQGIGRKTLCNLITEIFRQLGDNIWNRPLPDKKTLLACLQDLKGAKTWVLYPYFSGIIWKVLDFILKNPWKELLLKPKPWDYLAKNLFYMGKNSREPMKALAFCHLSSCSFSEAEKRLVSAKNFPLYRRSREVLAEYDLICTGKTLRSSWVEFLKTKFPGNELDVAYMVRYL